MENDGENVGENVVWRWRMSCGECWGECFAENVGENVVSRLIGNDEIKQKIVQIKKLANIQYHCYVNVACSLTSR